MKLNLTPKNKKTAIVIAVVLVVSIVLWIVLSKKEEDSVVGSLQNAVKSLKESASNNTATAKAISDVNASSGTRIFLTSSVPANTGEEIFLKAGNKIKVYKNNSTGSNYHTATAGEQDLNLGSLKEATGSWYKLKNSSFVSYRDVYHWIKRSDFEGNGILSVTR